MSEYVEVSDIDNFPSGFTTAQKQAVIDRVEDMIERLTHDYFYAKSFSTVFNGNGKNQLFLGFMPDILSVTEVKLSEVALSTSLFSYDENSVFRAALATAQCKAVEGVTLSGTGPVQIDLTAHGFITGETVRLISMVGISPSLDGEYGITKLDADSFTLNGTDSGDYSDSFTSGTACFATLAELHYLTDETPDGYFPKGTKNVKITGTYGWASCPAAIKQAAIILCRAESDSSLYTKYEDFVSERLGDYAYGRGDKPYLTGITEADALISHYVRRKPLMGMI